MNCADRPPERYEEWLACLQALQERPGEARALCERMRNGVFQERESPLLSSFQRRVLACVNRMLDLAAARFSHQCREALETADFCMLDLLFRHLAVRTRQALFFRDLDFLPEEFRLSTEHSLRERMTLFWDGALRALTREALDNSACGLEDALTAIRRIRLFPPSAQDGTPPGACKAALSAETAMGFAW